MLGKTPTLVRDSRLHRVDLCWSMSFNRSGVSLAASFWAFTAKHKEWKPSVGRARSACTINSLFWQFPGASKKNSQFKVSMEMPPPSGIRSIQVVWIQSAYILDPVHARHWIRALLFESHVLKAPAIWLKRSKRNRKSNLKKRAVSVLFRSSFQWPTPAGSHRPETN